MSFGISQMEHEREDIDAPLFMAWRIDVMPFKDIEIGFSRTAQFCGEQLECNLGCFLEHARSETTTSASTRRRRTSPATRWRGSTFAGIRRSAVGRMPSTRSTSARTNRATCRRSTSRSSASKCGSRWRTAGWCRGSSNTPPPPVRRAPTAVLTTTAPTTRADSTSKAIAITGRVIGYTADRDAENYTLGGTYTDAERRALVGHGAHVAAQSRRLRRRPQYRGLGSDRLRLAGVRLARQVVWRTVSAWISASKSIEPEGGERDVQPFGFVRWTHAFAP